MSSRDERRSDTRGADAFPCEACDGGHPQPPDDFHTPPSWVADAVFYQIFPDRFSHSERFAKPFNLEPWYADPTVHGYKGGDLYGVIDRLDWLEDLGITALYLNPIFQSTANHRYHTHDYAHVDPLLGGDEAFEALLDACHARDMRLVLDGVFNHASRGFLQFNDILENGPHSPYLDWFIVRDWPLNAYDADREPNYDAWWGMAALPKFNTDHPQAREFLMQVGEEWARRGIDGWRLDVPGEITTPGFWEEFRNRMRAINPELYIVGEIWEEASEWISGGDRFDGAMNYPFTGSMVAYTAGHRVTDEVAAELNYPAKPAASGADFGRAVGGLLELYPESATKANLNLLGSHDTSRILTVAGGDEDSVILAAVLLFTFSGAPCVYYGDEIGLEGGKDPANRAAFPWEHEERWNLRLLEVHRELIALRREWNALRHGGYETLPTPDGSLLHWFLRQSDGESLLVAVNAGDDAAAARAARPEAAGTVSTLWGDGGLKIQEGELMVALPPRSAAIWQIAAAAAPDEPYSDA